MDSYQQIFNELGITKDSFVKTAMNNIIWIEDNDIKAEWKNLKSKINNKEEVFVRNHGRNGSGETQLIELLKDIFDMNFKIDGSNNSKPSSLLKRCILSKKNLSIQNYQISHVFEERTNNPLLFTAPWMLCYTPKILDPFTGHECSGYDDVRKEFINIAQVKFKEYIEDYNRIILPYWKKLHDKFKGLSVYNKFEEHMIVALAPIYIKYEEMDSTEKKKKYIEEFNKLNSKD